MNVKRYTLAKVYRERMREREREREKTRTSLCFGLPRNHLSESSIDHFSEYETYRRIDTGLIEITGTYLYILYVNIYYYLSISTVCNVSSIGSNGSESYSACFVICNNVFLLHSLRMYICSFLFIVKIVFSFAVIP